MENISKNNFLSNVKQLQISLSSVSCLWQQWENHPLQCSVGKSRLRRPCFLSARSVFTSSPLIPLSSPSYYLTHLFGGSERAFQWTLIIYLWFTSTDTVQACQKQEFHPNHITDTSTAPLLVSGKSYHKATDKPIQAEICIHLGTDSGGYVRPHVFSIFLWKI